MATLEYLREYRTYAHIAASYDVAESNIYRGIRWAEDTLIKDGTFSLPGRNALRKSESEYEVILERGPTKLSYIAPTLGEVLGKNGINV